MMKANINYGVWSGDRQTEIRDSWLIFEIIDLKKYSEKYPMAIDAGAWNIEYI